MPITQTIEIPANSRRMTIDIPREVPAGPVILTFTPAKPAFEPHPCPVCREKFQDPVTGEMRYGPKTMAGMQEVEDMLAGRIPNTLKSFNTFEEMLADLNSDDDEEDE